MADFTKKETWHQLDQDKNPDLEEELTLLLTKKAARIRCYSTSELKGLPGFAVMGVLGRVYSQLLLATHNESKEQFKEGCKQSLNGLMTLLNRIEQEFEELKDFPSYAAKSGDPLVGQVDVDEINRQLCTKGTVKSKNHMKGKKWI